MNAKIESIAAIGGTRTGYRPEEVDLRPARGIIVAIGLSVVLWAASLALFLAA